MSTENSVWGFSLWDEWDETLKNLKTEILGRMSPPPPSNNSSSPPPSAENVPIERCSPQPPIEIETMERCSEPPIPKAAPSWMNKM
ncbi:hypothetical protein Trihar35433_2086 [Trichoderma harzianum]|nr:hypothetical protein Trihar35433_2086 [Trichoderma harzianum]